MEARAEAKYVRVSPRKVNYICKEIRGKQVDEALTILHFTPKKGAEVLEQVLRSAIANAENNLSLDRDTLVVSCLLYTSPSPRDLSTSRMPSSA